MRVDIPYVVTKRRADGQIAFYWSPPSHFLPQGMVREALGTDASAAALRAMELNCLLAGIKGSSAKPAKGSVAWGIAQYEADDQFTGLRDSTRRVYGQALKKIEATFGSWPAKGIRYKEAKGFYLAERKPTTDGGQERLGQANGALRVARLLWEFFINEEIASDNPFRRVRLSTLPARRALWERKQVEEFIGKADRLNCREIGTAAMLAFELCQREGDVLSLAWNQIKPTQVQIRQNKTEALVWLPLTDLPDLRCRLETTPRVSTLVIAQADGQPWLSNIHQFRKVVRRIADQAHIPAGLTFMDLRRSGLTELGEAGATDEEIRAVSGHKTREVVAAYVLPSDTQARNALRKRRRARTKV